MSDMERPRPSQYYRRPVLGRIRTRTLELEADDGEHILLPGREYEYIGVGDVGGQDIVYLCDAWNKPDVVQLVPGEFVEHVERYSCDG